MKLIFHFTLAAVAIISIAACTKTDDNADSINQSYCIKLASVHVYNENRYSAPDSLMDFIVSNMGIEKDTAVNSWLVKGASLDACDKELVSRFDKACALVDAEQYGGKYTVTALRKDAEGKYVTIASKEFISTADNTGKADIDRSIIPKARGYYIYDVAIAAGGGLEETLRYLKNAGFTVIDGDLNSTAGGYYIYVGVKFGTAETKTGITGNVINEYTGMTEVRELTAKEAAISNLVCIQDGGHPETFKGPVNTLYSKATFERFKQLGNSNGDTNQKAGGGCSYLYFTRDLNNIQHIEQMFYVTEEYSNYGIFGEKGEGSRFSELVKGSKYESGSGRCSSFGGNADMNIGTHCNYTHLGFYSVPDSSEQCNKGVRL